MNIHKRPTDITCRAQSLHSGTPDSRRRRTPLSQRSQSRRRDASRRRYFRHPTDIPVEILRDAGGVRDEVLRDVSGGGLSFRHREPLPVGDIVRVRIAVTAQAFEAPCRVVWCQAEGVSWQIGVEFLEQDDLFQARMIEQVCHIAQYRQEMRITQGRNLSSHEAAVEWIAKYARIFPNLAQDS
jgi:hypothetical protein